VSWEGPDAHCWLVVRREAGEELAVRCDGLPYDVLSPWRETQSRTWTEGELIELLAGIADGTVELTT
jgi:hypothetical protein